MTHNRLTFAKSHDRNFHPTPKFTVAIDKRATLLGRQVKMAPARYHFFDDVASMTYTFL